jgi:hypothetical protein
MQEFRGRGAKSAKYYALAFHALQAAAGALLAAAQPQQTQAQAQAALPPAEAVAAALAELRAVADIVTFKLLSAQLAQGLGPALVLPSGPAGAAPSGAGVSGAQAAVAHFQAHVRSPLCCRRRRRTRAHRRRRKRRRRRSRSQAGARSSRRRRWLRARTGRGWFGSTS